MRQDKALLRAAMMARANTVIVCSLLLAKNAMHSPTFYNIRPCTSVRRVSVHARLRYALLFIRNLSHIFTRCLVICADLTNERTLLNSTAFAVPLPNEAWSNAYGALSTQVCP